jgi:ribosomal protein S27E
MHFVRLHCPACGAPVAVASAQAAATCDYCGVRFAVASGASQPVPSTVAAQTETIQPLVSQPVRAPAAISNRRGCLWALIVWFFIGPLTAVLLLLPFAPFLERAEDGAVVPPDALALCLPVLVIGMTVYAFIHFRRSENTLWEYVAAPWRALRWISTPRSSRSSAA